MVEIKNVTKNFDRHTALKNFDLNIKKGSIYGLVGVNGAGKTTAIRHLAGMYLPNEGTIQIDGLPVYNNIEVKKRVGYIPDDLYFLPQYNMKRLRSFYRNMYKNWDDERYERLLSLFKLDEKRGIKKFSKGMQKQTAFIFSMSIKPDVLLLDEPIDGLDPIVRKQVFQEIIEDVAERQMTVLVSSHNLKEMDGICDAIGIVKNGQMIIERDLDDLKSDAHKIQVVFPEREHEKSEENAVNINPFNPYGDLTVLYQEKRGTVELLVVRGKEEDVSTQIKSYNPLVYDQLPLTLEEIFIYETEGVIDEIPY